MDSIVCKTSLFDVKKNLLNTLQHYVNEMKNKVGGKRRRGRNIHQTRLSSNIRWKINILHKKWCSE